MNIVVLSRDATLYSTNRLILEGKQRGHHVQVVDSLKCYIDIQTRTPQVIFQGKTLDYVDAVIPRVGTYHSFYGMTVVRQFQMMNTFCVNSSQAIARSRDKLRSMQILSKAGCNLPRTGFAHSIKDMDGLVDLVGGAPLVIKILEGTQGLGVVLAETKQVATSIMEAFRSLDVNILVQEYIKESGGADIRAFVVGSKVVAAMERKARPGDFRANVHRGGSSHKIKLTVEEKRLAIKAAKTLGLNVAGVDLLRSERGPLVIEVNSSPGLEGIETTTKTNVAARIYDYIEDNVSKKVTKDDA